MEAKEAGGLASLPGLPEGCHHVALVNAWGTAELCVSSSCSQNLIHRSSTPVTQRKYEKLIDPLTGPHFSILFVHFYSFQILYWEEN